MYRIYANFTSGIHSEVYLWYYLFLDIFQRNVPIQKIHFFCGFSYTTRSRNCIRNYFIYSSSSIYGVLPSTDICKWFLQKLFYICLQESLKKFAKLFFCWTISSRSVLWFFLKVSQGVFFQVVSQALSRKSSIYCFRIFVKKIWERLEVSLEVFLKGFIQVFSQEFLYKFLQGFSQEYFHK